MSNIAGKAYAMNVVTPIRWQTLWLNKAYFLGVKYFPEKLNGLITLSLIHYARWVIVGRKQFPHVSNDQPRETLLQIPNYNFEWQLGYEIEPGQKRLPKGTAIEAIAHYESLLVEFYAPWW